MQVGSAPVLFLLVVSLLAAQESPATPQSSRPDSPSTAQISEGSAAAFHFTKVDLTLLNESNATDVQFEQRNLVLHDPGVQAYVDAVGKRVLGNRPIPENVTYRFMVLRDPMVNAFALPNGSVYITTGLLALLENEAQLASVLGHETAHIYNRHTYLENRSIRKKTVAMEIISAAAAWVPGGFVYGLAAVAAADVSNLILVETVYGYSREMERRADRDGIAAMAAAGFDPHGMAVTFELLDQDRTFEYEPYPSFYHDHPQLVDRRTDALAFADAHTPPGAQTGSEADYLANIAPAIQSSIETDLGSRKPRTAVARAARLVGAFPKDAQDQMLLAESYRALGAKTTNPTQEEVTPKGEGQQRKLVVQMSEQQEQQKLLSKAAGRATQKENQDHAEKLFLAVIQEQPNDSIAYRELGMLYEDEARYADAATNYRHYLQLAASTSLDRLRIERRLAQCESHQTAEGH